MNQQQVSTDRTPVRSSADRTVFRSSVYAFVPGIFIEENHKIAVCHFQMTVLAGNWSLVNVPY